MHEADASSDFLSSNQPFPRAPLAAWSCNEARATSSASPSSQLTRARLYWCAVQAKRAAVASAQRHCHNAGSYYPPTQALLSRKATDRYLIPIPRFPRRRRNFHRPASSEGEGPQQKRVRAATAQKLKLSFQSLENSSQRLQGCHWRKRRQKASPAVSVTRGGQKAIGALQPVAGHWLVAAPGADAAVAAVRVLPQDAPLGGTPQVTRRRNAREKVG